jgi:hypothetical protein
MQFPEWSDLGSVSDITRHTWENETALRNEYRRYFDGSVFEEKVPVENISSDEAPLMYPVGVNLVKMLCTAQADSLFGEWQDQVITFETDQDNVSDSSYIAAIELLNEIFRASSGNTLFWEMDMDRQVYGGSALKITPSLATRGYIRWQRVPLDSFYPVFDPDNPDELLEVYTLLQMTAEQAVAKYRIKPTGGMVTRIEHWTPTMYENTIDGVKISAYSGVNPWGFVPYIYIPRLRTASWWGDALTQEIIPVQDELNMRLADLGEAISYSAHPTRWGVNLPRAFNAKNFPIGYSSMWDLGRTLGNNPAPTVGMLEARNPIPQSVFDYLKFIYDWARTSSFAPPIAFGEDQGGGQRSGATLEIRMWPLVKAVRRSRAYMSAGIQKAIWMTARILEQKRLSTIPVTALKKMADGKIVPNMPSIMPRDHQQVVDEIVKLLSTDPPSISLETAQKELSRGVGEVDRIRTMLEDKELWKPQPAKGETDVSQGKADQKADPA